MSQGWEEKWTQAQIPISVAISDQQLLTDENLMLFHWILQGIQINLKYLPHVSHELARTKAIQL